MNILFTRHFLVFLGLSALAVLGNGMYAQPTIAGEIRSGSLSKQNSPAPMPGTATTSAALLQTNPTSQPSQPAEAKETQDSQVAQVDIDPGQATRGGSSYIGIAGNIGLGGEAALGDDFNFTVISKIGFANVVALRPSAVIGDDTVILVPITYDFSIQPVDALDRVLPIAPYLGGGVAFSTGDDSDTAFLLTAGVDFPITSQFTATAAVNAAFFDDTDVGLLLGVGYNFPGF